MRMLSWSTTSTWGQQPSGRDGAAGNHPICSHSFPALSFQPSFSCSLAHLPFSLLLHFPDHIVHNFCKRKRWVGLSTLSPPAAPWDAPFPGNVWWGVFWRPGWGGDHPQHTHMVLKGSEGSTEQSPKEGGKGMGGVPLGHPHATALIQSTRTTTAA